MRTMQELRELVEKSEQFTIAHDQKARAYHQLMEVQAIAFNFAIAPRMSYPRLFHNTSWQTDVYSSGGNSPDFYYGTVFLDGSQTYRLSGNIRDSKLLLAQHNSALPGSPGSKMVGNYDFSDFSIAADGSFEIILSAERHDGNWIGLVESSYQWLLFRPTVEGWDAKAAELRIERISTIEHDHYRADDFDEAATARRIDAAADFARYMVTDWMIAFWPRIFKNAGGVNRLWQITEDVAGEVGSPTARYVMGVYEIAEDEAMILELPKTPDGVYWGFQLFDVWLHTIDFRTRQSTLNSRQIAPNSDGSIFVVLAHRDPGIANWLDTSGFTRGQILLRNYRSVTSSIPDIRVVKLDRLEQALPKETPRVTSEQRATTLARRRTMYLKRHGE
eukprot:TRINITY_DN14602_c0_g2_i1.p1 TRINITY_DN14602_c0_g2~~TRINITY_DN14602_c0_g2_i1.p1  ORF type:complete len:405 (+),score=77.45 TRINITY_DN14602_c0_g2_i1:49-1215(+)